jgi:3-dehydroquinate dehydratase-2
MEGEPAEMKILLIHGPNLNLLGKREPGIYGLKNLEEINTQVQHFAQENRAELKIFQSNSEGELVDAIQDAGEWADGIVINPGAYTHYSYAIRDALASVGLPAVEIHLSNIFAREEFRHRSVISAVVEGTVTGLGWRGYIAAVEGLIGILEDRAE